MPLERASSVKLSARPAGRSAVWLALAAAAAGSSACRPGMAASAAVQAPLEPAVSDRPSVRQAQPQPQPQFQPQPQPPGGPAAQEPPVGHSPMWRALAAAAASEQPTPLLPSDFRPAAEPLPPPQPKRRLAMAGIDRLGALGGRIRLSEGNVRRSGFRPMRAALLALVTLLGGMLGAMYYLGDDMTIIIEELAGLGQEPVRRPPARRPVTAAKTPKPAKEPAKPQEMAKAEPSVQEPAKPEAGKEPNQETAAPVPPPSVPEPGPAVPPEKAPMPIAPGIKPAGSPADAALDKILAEAQRKTVEDKAAKERAIAERAATDLPGLLAEVRKSKAETAARPQIDIRQSKETPAAASPSPDSKVDLVRVRSASEQTREASEKAYELLLSGQYEGAALVYEDVLKRDPRNLSALIGRATALHKLGRLVDARILYEQVLAISPGNREVLANLMTIYGAQDPSEALRQLELLQRDNPGYSPIPAQMAALYAQAGDLAQAIRFQGLAVQLSPENLLYRFNLAVMQDRAGLSREAAASYEVVLAMASNGSGATLPMPVGQVKERLAYLRTR